MWGTSDPGEGKEGRYLLLDVSVSFSNVEWGKFRRKEGLVCSLDLLSFMGCLKYPFVE